MAQARNIAKSTFSEGLVMDFAPDNTQANVLSNALNATLLTYNGNEGSLQNDMGNARVESAFLPEGYVPVGTCEFGDIIYIVSYNPLEGKSQVGCFPSPERNISNKEISDMEQSINSKELASKGEIHSSSVKKIIFGNSNLSAGDKFVISWGTSGLNNYNYISNYGNTSHDTISKEKYWPKLTKIHIVSIDDSGAITYLDNEVKWYGNLIQDDETHEAIHSDYVITDLKFVTSTGEDDTANLDEYRNALQCQYSVFQSRIPGKLALLLELETINSFSCAHKVIKYTSENRNYFDIYLSAYWGTDNYNVNPCGMLITDCKMDDGISPEMNKYIEVDSHNIHNVERLIPFNRLYEIENPPSDYVTFLQQSYYNNVSDYDTLLKNSSKFEIKKYLTDENSKVEYILNYVPVSNIVRVQVQEQGKTVPKEDANGSYYAANPMGLVKGEYVAHYFTTINGEQYYTLDTIVPDDIVVNRFGKSVLKKVATVSMDPKTISDKERTLTYTVAPCMPYGALDHFAITNTINFDRQGDGKANLTQWRYYVRDKSIILNFGFDPTLRNDENEIIEKVLIEFYDNQGICATYELNNLESYSGQFTEYFNLQEFSSNFRMHNMTLDPEKPLSRELSKKIAHASDTVITYGKIKRSKEVQDYVFIKYDENGENGKFVNITETEFPSLDTDLVFYNDAGVLYYGRPYLAKIKIFKGTEQEFGGIQINPDQEQPEEYIRWMWTAPVFNDQWLDGGPNDFNECDLKIDLDFLATFDGSKLHSLKKTALYYKDSVNNSQDTLGAQVDYFNLTNSIPNIKFTGKPVLADSFKDSMFLNTNAYNNIDVSLGLNNKRIIVENTSTQFEDTYVSELDQLKTRWDNEEVDVSNLGSELLKALGINKAGTNKELYENDGTYYANVEDYKDRFSLSLSYSKNGSPQTAELTDVEYLDYQGNTHVVNIPMYKMNAEEWIKGADLTLKGIKFNKLIAGSIIESNNAKILESIVSEPTSLESYGINLLTTNGIPYFKLILYFGMMEKGSENTYITGGTLMFENRLDLPRMSNLTEHEENDEITAAFSQDRVKKLYKLGTTNFPFQQIVFGKGYRGKESNLDSIECFPSPYSLTQKQGRYLYNEKSQNVIDWRVQDFNSDYAKPGIVLSESGKPIFNPRFGRPSNLFSALGYSYEDTFYIIADAAILNINSSGNLSLEIPWKNKTTNTLKTYAQALASMFLQLYKVSNSNVRQVKFANIATLKDYNESWKMDIVVKLKSNIEDRDSFGEKSTANFIGIIPKLTDKGFGFNLASYCNSVLEQAGLDAHNVGELNFRNINPELVNNVRCIEFDYTLPYNANDLKARYKDRATASNYLLKAVYTSTECPESLLSNKSRGFDNELIPIYHELYPNKLYIYNGGNAVQEFSAGSQFNLISKFDNTVRVVGLDSGVKLDINRNSGFSEAISFDGNTIKIADPSKLSGSKSTYYLKWYCSGDNPILNGLQQINIFNYGKFL